MRNLESEFPATEDSPLLKITLPIKQSVRLLELCNKVGITGAVIYPSADGAGKAVTDSMNLMRVGRQLIDAGL